MDTTVTHQSKPQWRFNRPHRVRLHNYQVHIKELVNGNVGDKEFYHQAAHEFSQTDRYKWAESNSIKIDFCIDNHNVDWFKQVRFYADLDEEQYTNYCLRFFNHHDEEWK